VHEITSQDAGAARKHNGCISNASDIAGKNFPANDLISRNICANDER